MKLLSILLVLLACNQPSTSSNTTTAASSSTTETLAVHDSIVPPAYDNGKLIKINKSEEEWKNQLSEMAFHVLRKEGTERAFTGKLWDNHQKGTYVCAGCGLPLFSSETKFDSGTGWPSFYQPITKDCIADFEDNSHGMDRTEVECARCGGHQGHVFPDGPPPTGMRYCINSVSLNFVKQ
ncbi:MAG: peptide-methionine (R)-S-oxide reductase MsrB [Saprospiraceae bacterium]|nr:peptide-methionine (R)-S-oxide reductase MsrB [Saprospiraceae bacterium]